MHSKILNLLKAPIGERVENFLSDMSQNLLKPRVYAQPPDSFYLAIKQTQSRKIEDLEVQSENRKLVAHKLQLTENHPEDKSNLTLRKKAIVYLPGNCPYISDSLPEMEPVLKDLVNSVSKVNHTSMIAVFCQHYRGRGANQVKHSENFNDYTMHQDAKDQAALLLKLIQLGYQPEDILVLGYSYGSAVGLWAIHHLASNFDSAYSNIKFYSDRGFGNLFDFPYIIKPFIVDQTAAHHKLYQKGMMPELPLREIVVKSVPESFIFHIENDKCIWIDFSLAGSLSQTKLPGRIFSGEADVEDKPEFANYPSVFKNNPHLATRSAIHLKFISELKPNHFITAMLTEIPISIVFKYKFTQSISGYALKLDAKSGESEFIDIPEKILQKKEKPAAIKQTFLATNVIANFLQQLHEYCNKRAERAAASGYGGDFKKPLVGSSGFVGWTARQQIQMAIHLMNFLCDENGPNVEAIVALHGETGPHDSGALALIYTQLMQFIEEYKKLQCFNGWVGSMPQRRLERKEKQLKHDAELGEWETIDDVNAPTCKLSPALAN
ncbi:MAG: hypothetical protein ABI370_06280 [Gammaproteobacteria bacterium]